MATDIMATSTTKLHSILLTRFTRFVFASLKMRLASLGAEIKFKLIKNNTFTAIGDGCYFGDVAVFNRNSKRTATVTTKTLCIMYTIQRNTLFDCLTDFPEIRTYMEMVSKKRHRRMLALDPSLTSQNSDKDLLDDEDSKTDLFRELDDSGENGGSSGGLGWDQVEKGFAPLGNAGEMKIEMQRRKSENRRKSSAYQVKQQGLQLGPQGHGSPMQRVVVPKPQLLTTKSKIDINDQVKELNKVRRIERSRNRIY